MKLRLALIFIDRVGGVADISAVIADHGLNIFFMEVVREADQGIVYLETENRANQTRPEKRFDIIGHIPDLIEIRFIDTLPITGGNIMALSIQFNLYLLLMLVIVETDD